MTAAMKAAGANGATDAAEPGYWRARALLVGTRPLLQHSPAMLLAEAAMPKRMKHRLAGAPDAETEARMLLYPLPGGGYGHPGMAVWRAMVEAAKGWRIGRLTLSSLVQSAVLVEEHLVPLVDPETGQLLGDDAWRVDAQRVRVQREYIARVRPRWDRWALRPTLRVDAQILGRDQAATLQQVLTMAGRTVGLGDFRPYFGRFAVAEFTVLAE